MLPIGILRQFRVDMVTFSAHIRVNMLGKSRSALLSLSWAGNDVQTCGRCEMMSHPLDALSPPFLKNKHYRRRWQ